MGQTDDKREASRRGGLASGARRREERQKKATDPLYGVKKRLARHFDELEKAARGEGAWKELSDRERLTALMKVIEYGVGKPIGVDKVTPRDVQSEGGGTDPVGTLQFE